MERRHSCRQILTTFHRKKSFKIGNFISGRYKDITVAIAAGLIFNELNSEEGLKVTFDKPAGSRHYMCNLIRPAVLRQFFGKITTNGNEVCSYGDGSGALTVGTHPLYQVTRPMTPQISRLAQTVYTKLVKLQKDELIPDSGVEPLNHCTVLFYFHKSPKSPNKMLGYHTDNIYTKKGKFVHSQNTQKEGTPTCVLTIGATRMLSLQLQCLIKNKKTKRQVWKELFTSTTDLAVSYTHLTLPTIYSV